MKLLLASLLFICTNNSFAAGWIQQADFGGTARHRTTMLSLGNKIYAGLGHYNGAGPNILFEDWWEYDPATNAWTQKADYAGGICYHAAGFSVNNVGYVGTGRISPSGNTLVKDFFKYEPATNTWTQLTDFPGVGRRGAIGFSIGQYGYMGTGSGPADMYRYDPANDTWIQITDVPGGNRMSAVGFSLNGRGYVGTGFLSNLGWSSTDFHEYNPATNSWTQIDDVGIDPLEGPIPRMESSGFALDGKGYVLTGVNISSGDNYKDMWELDPTTGSWTRIEDFPGTARRYLSSVTHNGYAYVGLGTNGTNFKDFWKYDKTLALLQQNIESIQVNVFPNPSIDYVQIEMNGLPENAVEKMTVKMYTLLGKSIEEKSMTQNQVSFVTSGLPSGLYLYSINYDGIVLRSGKIQVQ